MSTSSASPLAVPLRLSGASLPMKAAFVVLGSLVLAASSWIKVPMYPVPMTMQTYAVLLVGALCGWRVGLATVMAWLGQAFIGLPMLANGAAGPLQFVGPTAGYIAAFPLAAVLVGFMAERGWTAGPVRSFAVMMVGHALILALGWAWLSGIIGAEKALAAGVMPFLWGSVLKSALVVATVEAVRRGAWRRSA